MQAPAPRIVNIYNFVRAYEPRDPVANAALWQTTANEIELTRKYDLPATFALQYDALIDPRYPKLLKERLTDRDEIGAWWEIVQPLVEKAGLKWRGRYAWDWRANIGSSPGYTVEERLRLVEVYMAEFKSIFGRYPRTVGSWFIDERTLEYMAEKYGVLASANCKDQIGTDGYTLWGGYWNQAYYPSRKNAYMPAQTEAGELPVPIFRMLGSDPIYQYDRSLGEEAQGVVTLEPVSKQAGASPAWVRWYFDLLVNQPPLAFAYAQTGQENSFGWPAIREGLEDQLRVIAALAKEDKVRVETLEQSGRWFRSRFKTTPSTSVVALADWKGEGRSTVWYDSRYYRINLLWQGDTFRVRDLHLFDESRSSPYYDKVLTETSSRYTTLALMDGSSSMSPLGRRFWGSRAPRPRPRRRSSAHRPRARTDPGTGCRRSAVQQFRRG